MLLQTLAHNLVYLLAGNWISLANNLKRTWAAVAPVVRAKRCKNVTKRQQKCVPMPLKNPAKREENQLVGLVSKGT